MHIDEQIAIGADCLTNGRAACYAVSLELLNLIFACQADMGFVEGCQLYCVEAGGERLILA
jgi:hypothetical protein